MYMEECPRITEQLIIGKKWLAALRMAEEC
jgi:hypothetical protein